MTVRAALPADARLWPVAALPLAVAVLAIVLPVEGTARLLASGGVAPESRFIGVWLLKGALLATAVAALVSARVGRRGPEGEPAAAESAPVDRGALLALGAIVTVGAVLRLIGLGEELWVDEIDTLYNHVRLPFGEIIGTYASQNQHPLYSILARVSYLAMGKAEWAIRLPAVVFGVGSLWMTFLFARRLAGRTEALLASLILAVSYHHVWFSQNARGYTGILFFALLGTWMMLRLINAETAHPLATAWAYAAVMALAAYTHLTAVLIVVGHAMTLVLLWLRRRDPELTRRYLWSAAAIVFSALLTLVVYAVVLPQLIPEVTKTRGDGSTIEWTRPIWFITESLRVLATGTPGGALFAVIALGVVAVGVVSYWRRSPAAVLLMLLPAVITGAVLVMLHHNLWPRFFFFGAAFFVLFAIRGGFAIARAVVPSSANRLAVAGALAVAALSAVTVPRAWLPKQQFKRAADYVDASRRPGDKAVAIDVAALIYDLYPRRDGWHLISSLDSLTAIERSGGRTWAVYTFTPRLRSLHPDLAQRLESAAYRPDRIFPASVGGGEIHVVIRDSGAGYD